MWSILKGVINDTIASHVPKVRQSFYKSPKRFSGEIKRHLHQLRFFWKKRRTSGDHSLYFSRVSSLEVTLQEEIATARPCYEANLVDKFAFSNDNAIYEYIHHLLKSNVLPNTVIFGDESATSDEDKARLFCTLSFRLNVLSLIFFS